MSKFQVGERVAAYENGERYIALIHAIKGPAYYINFREAKFLVHEKQIRRLQPKKPLRTFWIHEDYRGGVDVYRGIHGPESCENSNTIKCIEVREVRKKKQ